MKLLSFVILVFLAFSVSAGAAINPQPDSTLLVSDIYDLKFINDDIVVAVTLNGVSCFVFDEECSQFVFYREIPVDFQSPVMKLFDDLIVVSDADGKIHFISAAAAPDLTYLAEADLEIPIRDFAMAGSYLYVSSYFEGIRRYLVEDFHHPEFLDYDKTGVFLSELDIWNDTLYAIDEYRGLMRYDLSGTGFGEFIDYLYLPRRAYNFTRHESDFYLAYSSGCYVGDLGGTAPVIVDSVTDLDSTVEMYATEDFLILVFEARVQLRPRSDLGNATILLTSNNRSRGDLRLADGESQLILPERDGGMTVFDLDDAGSRWSGLYREGAITGLLIYDDKLFTCGISMPIDVYGILDSKVDYEYTIFETWDSTCLMTHNGDTLIALSAHTTTNLAIFYVNSTSPDAYIGNAFSTSAVTTQDLIYLDETVNGERIVLAVKDRSIDIWAILDESQAIRVNSWTWGEDIVNVTAKGSVIYVEGFRYPEIQAYTFDAQFNRVFHEAIGLTYDPFKMLVVGDFLYTLQWGMIKLLDITDPVDPSQGPALALPFTAYDACLYGRWLYCVGPEGILVLDASTQPPVVVDQGGRGGISLAVGSDILAVNSGDGMYIYQIDTTDLITWTPIDSIMPDRFSLSQNYPNPFNLSTTISYNLEREADVRLSIYNSLGQKVATLVNTTQSAGAYQVRWDGLTANGTEAATGVYFYKLTAGDIRESRKMLLIK